MVLTPVDPCVRLTVFCEAASAKFGVPITVRLIAVVLFKLPELPVTVTVTVPEATALLAVSVRVLVVKALFGANEAVTPLGRPDADKLTLPEKPPWRATVMVTVLLLPCTRVRLLGEAVRAKPWIGVTPGQLFTKFVALIVPIPVAKSQPVVVP
jgi:hypothetical protein